MQPQPYPRAVPPSCLTTVAGHEPSVICPNWIATWASSQNSKHQEEIWQNQFTTVWFHHLEKLTRALMASLNQGLLKHMGPWSKPVLPKDTGGSNKISTQIQWVHLKWRNPHSESEKRGNDSETMASGISYFQTKPNRLFHMSMNFLLWMVLVHTLSQYAHQPPRHVMSHCW